MTQTINALFGQSMALIPIVVLVTDFFLDKPSPRRTGLLAFTVGAAILSGFIPAVMSAFFLLPFLIAADFAARFHSTDSPGSGAELLPRFIGFLAAIALGAGLAAFLLLAGASHQ